jgi:hypothetical protein
LVSLFLSLSLSLPLSLSLALSLSLSMCPHLLRPLSSFRPVRLCQPPRRALPSRARRRDPGPGAERRAQAAGRARRRHLRGGARCEGAAVVELGEAGDGEGECVGGEEGEGEGEERAPG